MDCGQVTIPPLTRIYKLNFDVIKSDSNSYTRRGIIICDDKELVTAAVSNSKLGSGDTLVELALGATRAVMFAKEIGLSAVIVLLSPIQGVSNGPT